MAATDGEAAGFLVGGILTVGIGVGVDISEALTVAAYPDVAPAVFADAHHRGGETLLEVALQPLIRIEAVETVLVGTYPAASLAVDEGAEHAGLSYQVLAAQFVAHVFESARLLGLHVDTFLQKSQPDVAAAVFLYGVHLASGEVYLRDEVGIVRRLSGLGIVDGRTLAVVADHDPPVATAVESGNVLVARHVEMPELTALGGAYESAPGGGADVDGAVFAETESQDGVALVFGCEVFGDFLSVVFVEPQVSGGYPDVPLAVFYQVVHGVDVL